MPRNCIDLADSTQIIYTTPTHSLLFFIFSLLFDASVKIFCFNECVECFHSIAQNFYPFDVTIRIYKISVRVEREKKKTSSLITYLSSLYT